MESRNIKTEFRKKLNGINKYFIGPYNIQSPQWQIGMNWIGIGTTVLNYCSDEASSCRQHESIPAFQRVLPWKPITSESKDVKSSDFRIVTSRLIIMVILTWDLNAALYNSSERPHSRQRQQPWWVKLWSSVSWILQRLHQSLPNYADFCFWDPGLLWCW